MNIKQSILTVFFLGMFCMFCYQNGNSQTNTQSSKDIIVLTISSDGTTEDEATNNALKLAIEQVYGIYISANTTVLNKGLSSAEITSDSNGMIEDFKEITAFKGNDNKYYVTLIAVINLPHLVTFAHNLGSECEFAGNSFGKEIKFLELQKENELKNLYNLSKQTILLSQNVMKHKLTVEDPRVPIYNEFTEDSSCDIPYFDSHSSGTKVIDFYPSKTTSKGYEAIPWEVNRLPIEPYWKRYAKLNTNARNHINQFRNKEDLISKYYVVPMTIKWEYDIQSETSIYELLTDVLFSLCLTGEEIENYRSKGLQLGELEYVNPSKDKVSLYFRNSTDDIYKWYRDMYTKLLHKSNNFIIKDNTNTESTFYPEDIDSRVYNYYNSLYANNKYDSENYEYLKGPNTSLDKTPLMLNGLPVNGLGNYYDGEAGRMFGIFGSGIFYDLFKVNYKGRSECLYPSMHINSLYKEKYVVSPLIPFVSLPQASNDAGSLKGYEWNINVFIPREDIGKYTKFWIEPKDQ